MAASTQDVLRRLYAPWTWLVFVPWLAFCTVAFGLVALAIAPFAPRASFQVGTAWAWTLCRLNWTRVRVVGREHARRGQAYVIMSNHQSHFDVLAFYGHWGRQFRWVMKKELRKVPVLGPATAAYGNIFIDRADRAAATASLKAAKPLFEQGISLMVFPEGTRSIDGRMKDFKKGGFMVALDAGLPILPVSITGTHRVLPGKRLRLLPGNVRITVHPPVPTAGLGVEDRDRLVTQVREVIASGLPLEERG